ncbi:MAG TPA: AAA family ATPase [Ktedonobacteraceae bacterium]|nr:AAA family ATPase [Ktedonobacteraceae bacterium]
MKVSIRNLGVIKEAEIDLKPFTVFIGPNNAGKTWLAYALSGVLGHYGLGQYSRAYIDDVVKETYPPLDNAIQQVLYEGNAKIDLVQFADEYGEIYFNNVARQASSWMQEFMDTERLSFEHLEMHISLTDTKDAFLNRILDSPEERNLAVGQSQRKPLLSLLKETGKRELYMYTSTEGSILEKLPDQVIKETVAATIFRVMHFGLYEAVNVFVTERTAFTAFPIFQNIGKQPSTTFFVRRLTEPVNFTKDLIGEAFQSSTAKRQREARSNSAINNYIQLAQLLEKQILGGGVDFSTPEPDPRREILFEPTKDTRMELPIASSMVKGIASLVLYLRYLAKPDEWLIIDEPEMNLHPEAQAKLTEFLAMLVNAGLPVLITTHSPYIVDHLSNLMKAAESTQPDAIQDKFYLHNKDAFISKDAVSVYFIDQGKAENMLDDDGVIHWGTFGTVSDRVSEIFFEL